jgi:quinol-cytochrome oxidoreductase complex cytochrome b subunit
MLKAIYFALHFAMIFLGVILAIHFDFWLGVILATTFVIKFFFMLPSVDQNERLRRYERQHQQWLKGNK